MMVRGLTKVFLTRHGEPVQALQDVDLEVARGQVVAILGPSGCGKSSLLRILAGLDRAYQGEVEWDSDHGADASRLRSATVFQADSTLPWLTVRSNVRLGLSGLRLSREQAGERIAAGLALVGLTDFADAYPHELSGGMRQRVAICRALATHPRLLLMDEPLAALDAQTRLVMQQELLNIWRQTESTVVYVTHDIEEAVALADRVVVLTARPGRIGLTKTVGFGPDRQVTELRRSDEFGELVVELWRAIADEVGSTLGAAR